MASQDLKYPDDPGYVASSETSFDAAASMLSAAATLRARVRGYIGVKGAAGATCDEIEEALDMRHQTCSARCRELVLDGQIIKTASVRHTRSGRNANIYVLP